MARTIPGRHPIAARTSSPTRHKAAACITISGTGRTGQTTTICQLTTEDSAKQFIREQCGGSATPGDFDHDELEIHLPGKDRAGVKWD